MYHIMIVDDSREIRDELAILLRANGYEVSVLQDFTDVAKSVIELSPQLVLLDINLPGQDGFRLCETIRKSTAIPIIFVTSRNSDMDELMSITIGGDDFITKPYNTSILLARISSLIRRVYVGRQNSSQVEVNGVTLDTAAGKVLCGGKAVELTRNELKILHFLMKNAGRIVSRQELVEHLWDNELYVDDNTLNVNITRIRGKLASLGSEDFIKTKRGLGYII